MNGKTELFAQQKQIAGNAETNNRIGIPRPRLRVVLSQVPSHAWQTARAVKSEPHAMLAATLTSIGIPCSIPRAGWTRAQRRGRFVGPTHPAMIAVRKISIALGMASVRVAGAVKKTLLE